jgi:prophage tail gpP-like protein
MESLCSTFEFVTVQSQPFDYRQWPITMGAKCDVLVDDEPVLKGYIEDININYDKDSHVVQVSGRDVTCDLVDCHKANRTYAYYKSTVKQIVTDTCAPFSIPVEIDESARAAANTVPNLAATFFAAGGDSLIGVIYKITRLAELYVMASTNGGLLLTTAGKRFADQQLKSGVNILRGGLKQSDKEKFSVYYVKGFGFENENQIKSKDWLWMNGTFPPKPPATYPDERTGATRYRPYSNMAENSVRLKGVGWRSKAEAQYRIGNSRKYNYMVQGWREKEGGELWAPNTNVVVVDPLFGISDPFLIEAVEYTQSDQGTTSNLTLCSREKYAAQAELNHIKTVFDEQRSKS